MSKNISIDRMLEIKRELNGTFGKDWIPLIPENGHYSVLWAIGEIGEMIDVIKKKGHKSIMEDKAVRDDFVKEIVDVMSYLTSVMVCYDISAEELTTAYEEKHKYNMRRFSGEEEKSSYSENYHRA